LKELKGTNSTNFSGTKDAANQEVKKDVSSLRYMALPNWAHDALLESSSNILGVTTRSDKVIGVEADDHPKSQIIGPVDTQDPTFPAKLCREFEALMHEKFQMSAMGELNFFLGLQVLQKEDVIFLSQDKHQVTPKECHLHAVKRIFRYLKGHPKLGLWYPKASPFDLVAYSDSDYGGASQDLIKMARLQFCDYHNMVAILEKGEYNSDFHPMVDFIAAFPLRARIAQSSALPTIANEPASPVRDVSKGDACPIDSGFRADQDRATIAKTSTMPHDSARRVTSPAVDEGREAATERISNDSEDVARVLTSMDAATVLARGIDVPIGSGSIPTVGPHATVISIGSERLQEQIDAQVARELKEKQEKEDRRMNEQIARDAEVARIHADEELQGMINSLNKSNETIAKYLKEYQDFASELPLEKRIELISDLVKYQGLTFEEIEAKFAEVWKQVEDFIPMGSKEETERLKRKGLNLEQEQVKKQKSL
nr:putative ribonuclease H-like domain-containing protein [Tanacetum cinerariifolium]